MCKNKGAEEIEILRVALDHLNKIRNDTGLDVEVLWSALGSLSVDPTKFLEAIFHGMCEWDT